MLPFTDVGLGIHFVFSLIIANLPQVSNQKMERGLARFPLKLYLFRKNTLTLFGKNSRVLEKAFFTIFLWLCSERYKFSVNTVKWVLTTLS